MAAANAPALLRDVDTWANLLNIAASLVYLAGSSVGMHMVAQGGDSQLEEAIVASSRIDVYGDALWFVDAWLFAASWYRDATAEEGEGAASATPHDGEGCALVEASAQTNDI